MKSTIYLQIDKGTPETLAVNTFPGGEVQVKVAEPCRFFGAKQVVIYVKLRCAEGIQALCQLKSIIDHYGSPAEVNLFLGYAAYSRQDRICAEGEALAAKVFATQINALKFDLVMTVDNHSPVIFALLDNVMEIGKELIFNSRTKFYQDYDVFVAPDLGASKQVEDLARLFGKQFVQGVKTRDPETGELSGFGSLIDDCELNFKKVLIVDDLCDGGGTFVGLAEHLEKWNSKIAKLSLYVTHGIFSKGTETLAKIFNDIYTTDTLIDGDLDGITIIKLLGDVK